jgi:hypothetical protein
MGSKRGQKGSFIEVFNGFIQKVLLQLPVKFMLKKSYSWRLKIFDFEKLKFHKKWHKKIRKREKGLLEQPRNLSIFTIWTIFNGEQGRYSPSKLKNAFLGSKTVREGHYLLRFCSKSPTRTTQEIYVKKVLLQAHRNYSKWGQKGVKKGHLLRFLTVLFKKAY